MIKRPKFILIFSVLLFLAGLLRIYFIVAQFTNLGGFTDIIIIYYLSEGIFYICTSIGLLLGKRWGWWLGIFFSIYGILGYIDPVLLKNSSPLFEFLVNSAFLNLNLLKTLFYVALTIYFLRESILDYFGIQELKVRFGFIVVSVAIGIKIILFI